MPEDRLPIFPVNAPDARLPVLSIAIREVSDAQRHVGILYAAHGGPHVVIELHDHHKLTQGEPHPAFYFAASIIDERLLFALAEWVGVVWNRNSDGKVPYSIRYCGKYFGPDGSLLQTGLGEGLTCATFVLAVFADYGLPLVDTNKWPGRLSDKKWKETILQVIAKSAPAPHVEAQRPFVSGAARFRPEEVAAAFVLYRDRAIKQREAEGVGKRINKAIARDTERTIAS